MRLFRKHVALFLSHKWAFTCLHAVGLFFGPSCITDRLVVHQQRHIPSTQQHAASVVATGTINNLHVNNIK